VETQEARYQQPNKKPKGSKRNRLFQQPHCKAPHVMFEFEKTSLSVPPPRQMSCGHDKKCFLWPGFSLSTPASAWLDRSLPRRHSGDERSFHESLITAAQRQQQQHVPLSRITGISSLRGPRPRGFDDGPRFQKCPVNNTLGFNRSVSQNNRQNGNRQFRQTDT
jgi:hypothetical protein